MTASLYGSEPPPGMRAADAGVREEQHTGNVGRCDVGNPGQGRRPLRIAFLSCGSFSHVVPYIEYFRDERHEVHWLTYDRPSRDLGVTVHDISWGARAQDRLSKWKYVLAAGSARRVLKQLAPDLVHGHFITAAGLIAWLSGFRPYVLTAHGTDMVKAMRSPGWRAIMRRALLRAAAVNVVSEELASRARQFGVPGEKLLVAPLGVETARFPLRQPGALSSPVRLLCTRNIGSFYDPETIVRACAILERRGLDFVMTFAAGGPMATKVQALVAANHIGHKVRFLGGFDNRDLPTLLHEHDLFISASLWDGTSVCLMEAMAAGVMPIVSRIASNAAWIQHGKTGLMFDCGDEGDLAAQIYRAVTDHDLRRHAILANGAAVRLRAERRETMAALERCYYRVAEGREVSAHQEVAP